MYFFGFSDIYFRFVTNMSENVSDQKLSTMEIADIKARLSIQTVLQHYGLQPDKNNMLCCLFHADDVASMKIYPNPNTFNCFGCGKNGDGIEFCTL